MSLSRRSGVAAHGLAALTLGLLLSTTAPAQTHVATVLAGGLNNPRGLSFGPDGGLYIAEAGIAAGGGPSTVVRGATVTYNETGSITRYFGGSTVRVITGLPTLWNGNTFGMEAGPTDIIFAPNGAPIVSIGGGIDPRVRTTAFSPVGSALQQVVTLGRSFDIGAHEAANNPAGGPVDSNPWRLANAPGGGTLVVDAGANSLLSIDASGTISTVATFATRTLGAATFEPVPTGLAVGADGNYYVGELTGAPFINGAARIYRITPTGTVSIFATGFTNIIDMAVGADGSLYALEYDSNGIIAPGNTGGLWRLAADGTRTLVYSDLLSHPTGLEIGADGAFYVSNIGEGTGLGQLLRISPVPEPSAWVLMAIGLSGLARATSRRRNALPTDVLRF